MTNYKVSDTLYHLDIPGTMDTTIFLSNRSTWILFNALKLTAGIHEGHPAVKTSSTNNKFTFGRPDQACSRSMRTERIR